MKFGHRVDFGADVAGFNTVIIDGVKGEGGARISGANRASLPPQPYAPPLPPSPPPSTSSRSRRPKRKTANASWSQEIATTRSPILASSPASPSPTSLSYVYPPDFARRLRIFERRIRSFARGTSAKSLGLRSRTIVGR